MHRACARALSPRILLGNRIGATEGSKVKSLRGESHTSTTLRWLRAEYCRRKPAVKIQGRGADGTPSLEDEGNEWSPWAGAVAQQSHVRLMGAPLGAAARQGSAACLYYEMQ